jgi:hypothetical protein
MVVYFICAYDEVEECDVAEDAVRRVELVLKNCLDDGC